MSETAYQRLARLVRAAGLPEVVEATSYGRPALKVAGKGFTGYRGEDAIPISIPSELKEMLLAAAPEIYYETDHYKGWPWLLVRMSAISDEELTQRLIDAWSFRAPKRLADSFHR
jgi:hypothetical protein